MLEWKVKIKKIDEEKKLKPKSGWRVQREICNEETEHCRVR